MRLVLIGPHFPEYCLRYAVAMAAHGPVRLFVDGAQLDAEFAGRVIPGGDVSGLDVRRNAFRTPLDLLRMLRAIHRFRPTVIHMQEAAGPRRTAFLACVAWLMRRSATIILTVHDPVPHVGRDQDAARRFAGLRTRVRNHANVLVGHGAFCADLLRSQATAGQRVIDVPHGVILSPDAVTPPPAGPAHFYAFGRMEAYKGVQVLLEAAERLHRQQVDFRLTVAGRGPELDRLLSRFRLLPEVTVVNGFVPPTDVIANIAAAHCVVLPYISATQSGVLSAAFAGSRCVIASQTGGLPDVVTHLSDGLLVAPGDAGELASAMRRLAADSDLRVALCSGAGETGATRLDWVDIARHMLLNLRATA